MTRLRLLKKATVHRLALLVLAGGLAVGQWSCAASGLTPDPSPMPTARAGLRPEYRLFYDALADYGDWVLIEPFGWVFRPRVGYDQWNPYWDGFWSPTDLYGWVWVSAEPFGWATYHYGRWYQDDYEGWVWVPGLDWAPAWVSWNTNDDYVGWAALGPGSAWTSAARGAHYSFVPRGEMGSTDIRSEIVSTDKVIAGASRLQAVENLAESEGVTFNRGPSVEWVERVTGPLARARLEELVAPGTATAGPQPGAKRLAGKTAAAERDMPMRRAAEEAARRVRAIILQKQAAPTTLPIWRPSSLSERPAAEPQKSVPEKTAPDKPALETPSSPPQQQSDQAASDKAAPVKPTKPGDVKRMPRKPVPPRPLASEPVPGKPARPDSTR